jgi:hypothetical protein
MKSDEGRRFVCLPGAVLIFGFTLIFGPCSGYGFQAAALGSVVESLQATISSEPLAIRSTVFSGDELQVGEGMAVIATSGGSRVAFSRNSRTEFRGDRANVGLKLGAGEISLYHPVKAGRMRVEIQELAVTPEPGFRTRGEIAMVQQAVVITAREGRLWVEGAGSPLEVKQGSSVTLIPQRAPQTGASATQSKNKTKYIMLAGAGGAAAVLGGIAISRSHSADDAQAQAAEAAAAAQAQMIASECASNKVAAAAGVPSPYNLPPGTCK